MGIDNQLFNELTKDTQAFTENGMPTNTTTGNPLVDLFFCAGAVRQRATEPDVVESIKEAVRYDFRLAGQLALWARDCRGGAGERRFYRVMLNIMANSAHNHENGDAIVKQMICMTPEVGRWDDLFYLYGTPYWHTAVKLIFAGLSDYEFKGLVSKWIPRKGPIFESLRKKAGMNPRSFRKMLVRNTVVIENNLCNKTLQYAEFDKVPSLAMSRYMNAFKRRVPENFAEYERQLESGEKTVNASVLYPYDIFKSLGAGGSETVAEEQWKALPDFMEGSEFETIVPVVDTSGSMNSPVSGSTRAIDVSVSLGLYLAERNRGPFGARFITFSREPEFQKINTENRLSEKLWDLSNAEWQFNTDIEAVFDRVLSMAQDSNVPDSQMPDAILIISDMEFDHATSTDGFALFSSSSDGMDGYNMAVKKFREAGYSVPKLVFWNVCSRHSNFPAVEENEGVALVSGFSPSIMKSVLSGNLEKFSPKNIMLETIDSDRYHIDVND